MPVDIISIGLKPEITSETTDYLIGGISNKIVATLHIRALWIAVAGLIADDQDMEFDAQTSTITWSGGNFISAGFYDVDTIFIANTTLNKGTYTITDINAIGDVITVAEALTDEDSETAIIEGVVECTGLNFRYNLLENGDPTSFLSLVDGNELKFSLAGLDYTNTSPVAAIQQGVYKSNHQGSVTAAGFGDEVASGSGAGGSGDFDFTSAGSIIEWDGGGSFLTEGFSAGDIITVTGSSSNNDTYRIFSVTATQIVVYGSITNENNSTTTVITHQRINEFTIVHTFYINPLFLLDQITEIEAFTAPPYYFNDSSLSYLYETELLYNLSDPNRVHINPDVEFLLGNAGWFNENFNQGLPAFTIDPIVYKVAGNVVAKPDFNLVTDVEITVNSADGVFSNSNTEFIFNHFLLPEEESQYIDTDTDFTTNFMFDRLRQVVGNPALNGDNFGTDKQVLTDVSATFVSANLMTMKAKLQPSAAYISRIEALTNRQFVLAISIQDHTKATEESDLVVLYDGVDAYDTDLSNSDIADIDMLLTQYPGNAICSQSMFVEDTLRLNSIILVETVDGALIESTSAIIKAVKSDGSSFEMERRDFSFAGAVVQSGVQQINIVEPRGFIFGTNNPFNTVQMIRRADLDNGTIKAYEMIYSFKIRWEDFIQLSGVHADFYDIAEKFNGFNQNWNEYFTGAGWELKIETSASIEENTFVNVVSEELTLQAWDYEDSTYWTQQIKIFDIDSGDEISGFILSDKQVEIKAIFTKNVGTVPALSEVHGLIEVEPFEEGGINIIRNISTEYAFESDSPFESVTGLSDDLLLKEKSGSTFTFTARLDGSKLSGAPKLSARIYDDTCIPAETCSKEFEDDQDFDFEDGVEYNFEDEGDCECIFLLDPCQVPNALFAVGTQILNTGITEWGATHLVFGKDYIISLVDQTGNGFDGSTAGFAFEPFLESGRAQFESNSGADAFRNKFDISAGSTAADFSIFFDIKVPSSFLGADVTTYNVDDLVISITFGGAIEVSYNGGADTLTTGVLSADTEYKVLIERDGSDINLILDGVQVDTSSTGTAFTLTNTVSYGYEIPTLSVFLSNALIQWERVLTADEKTALFA